MEHLILEKLEYDYLSDFVLALQLREPNIRILTIFAPNDQILEFSKQLYDIASFQHNIEDNSKINVSTLNILNITIKFIPSELLDYDISLN